MLLGHQEAALSAASGLATLENALQLSSNAHENMMTSSADLCSIGLGVLTTAGQQAQAHHMLRRGGAHRAQALRRRRHLHQQESSSRCTVECVAPGLHDHPRLCACTICRPLRHYVCAVHRCRRKCISTRGAIWIMSATWLVTVCRRVGSIVAGSSSSFSAPGSIGAGTSSRGGLGMPCRTQKNLSQPSQTCYNIKGSALHPQRTKWLTHATPATPVLQCSVQSCDVLCRGV